MRSDKFGSSYESKQDDPTPENDDDCRCCRLVDEDIEEQVENNQKVDHPEHTYSSSFIQIMW